MGTPDFAVATLATIMAHKYTVVGVITAPDRPAGRGRKLRASAVKEYAVAQNIPVLQPTNLKDPQFLEELAALKANLHIVVAFRMLPKVVWNMPEYGTFNLHASLLPDYRGAAPINWAIINGEEKTGITTFFIDEKIDTGHIILQKEVAITPTETAGTLHDKLMNEGAALVIDTLEKITDATVTTTPQPQTTQSKTAYKLHRDNTKIDWQQDCTIIYNLIRGLSPYPAAWCTLHNKEQVVNVKVYEVRIEKAAHTQTVGTIDTSEDTIKIAAKNGFILIDKMQLPGKKAMDTKSLLNGYTFYADAKMC